MQRIAGRAGRIRTEPAGRRDISWRPQSLSLPIRFSGCSRDFQTTRHAARPKIQNILLGATARAVKFPSSDVSQTPELAGEDTISAIRRAMFLPIPTTYPSLNNPLLESQVLGTNSDKTSAYAIAYDYERLEWLGDRELNAIAADVCFVLGPSDSIQLAWMQNQFSAIHTNAFGVKIARHCGISAKFTSRGGGAPTDDVIADRFEAYIAALYLVGGREATRTFLAPYFYHHIMSTYDSLPPLKESPAPFVSTSTTKSSPSPSPVVTPPTPSLPSPVIPPSTPGSSTVQKATTPTSPKSSSARTLVPAPLVPSPKLPVLRTSTTTPISTPETTISTSTRVASPTASTVPASKASPSPSTSPTTVTATSSATVDRIVTDDPAFDDFMFLGEPVIVNSVLIGAQYLAIALRNRKANDHPLTRRIRRVNATLTCRLDYGYPDLQYRLSTQTAKVHVDDLSRLIRRMMLFKLIECRFSAPSSQSPWRNYVAPIANPTDPVTAAGEGVLDLSTQIQMPSASPAAMTTSRRAPFALDLASQNSTRTSRSRSRRRLPSNHVVPTPALQDSSCIASTTISPSTALPGIATSLVTTEHIITDESTLAALTSQPKSDLVDESSSRRLDDSASLPTDVSILHALTSSDESQVEAVEDPAPFSSSSVSAAEESGGEGAEEESLNTDEARDDEAILRAFTADQELDSNFASSPSELKDSEDDSEDDTILDSELEDEEKDEEGEERMSTLGVDFSSPPTVLRRHAQTSSSDATEYEDPESLEFVLVDSEDQDEMDLDSTAEELDGLEVAAEMNDGSSEFEEEVDNDDDSIEIVGEEIEEEKLDSSDDAAGTTDGIDGEVPTAASMEADDLAEIYQSIEREEQSTTKESMEPFTPEELNAMESFSNGSSSSSTSPGPPNLDSPASATTNPDQIEEQPTKSAPQGQKSLLSQAAGVLSAFRSPWKRS